MKAQSIEWTGLKNVTETRNLNPAYKLNSATRLVSRGILAFTPALAIVVGAAWMVSAPGLLVYLQATLWASGFIFFGLALESEKSAIWMSIATGFALPALALLSSKVSVEFAIVAAAILSGWLVAAIWRR